MNDDNGTPNEGKNAEKEEKEIVTSAENSGSDSEETPNTKVVEEASPEVVEIPKKEEESAPEEKKVEVPKVAEEKVEAEESIAKEKAVEEESEEDESAEEETVEEEAVDYSKSSLEEILEASIAMLKEEDIRKADKAFVAMREVVDKLNSEAAETQKTAYVADNEGVDEGFVYNAPEGINVFYTNFKAHDQKKKEHYSSLRKERGDNLKAKQKIIQDIKELIDSEDQKGSFEKMKEFQNKWKEIGSVPQAEAENLYRTYSAILDLFYDHKSIEHDLKELDRKKNLDAKLSLCEKAEALLSEENLNNAVKALNKLHEEYKAIGPIPKEQQEEVWQRFKKASDELYEKKRAFAEEYKKQLQENMKIKQELCIKLEEYVTFDSDRIKAWNEKTKELLAVQKDWEKIGPLPREVAKDINKQFWGNFKAFFANKNKFFEQLEASRKENLAKKEELCVKAEALKESSEWNETADKLKGLQQEWKKVGPVPESHRDSIYERFKAACDFFFERKRNKRSEQDKEFVVNLEKKLAIIKKIDELAEKKEENEGELEALKNEFLEIGYVPRKDINSILDKFLYALDNYYDNLPLDEDKIDAMKLQARVEIYNEVPSVISKLKKQEQVLRKKITHLENDIALWKNNLEFFAKSKTADKLKEQFTSKIETATVQLKDLKKQIRVIRNIG
ncbi:DUF349 domain-containing protein [Flammeovirgaceae bacterium SG7u.111]|nr:DUF349 domain-containing protein [Flammeovirgaceae bacterium SG7u.132]WPO33515.1 DUF349 domain-containing protein [Flammeovirgaceae bacterium SG7u.111]